MGESGPLGTSLPAAGGSAATATPPGNTSANTAQTAATLEAANLKLFTIKHFLIMGYITGQSLSELIGLIPKRGYGLFFGQF